MDISVTLCLLKMSLLKAIVGQSFYFNNSWLKDSPFTYKIYSTILKFLEKLTCSEIFLRWDGGYL